MPEYKVTVTEEIQYEVTVVADDEDQAIEDACDVIINAEKRDEYFVACVERYGAVNGAA
jgi:membrane-anchored protein YejM (alkaline phosphatase superfamily)